MRIEGRNHAPLGIAELAGIPLLRVLHAGTQVRQVFLHVEQFELALFQRSRAGQIVFLARQHEEDPPRLLCDPHLFVRAEPAGKDIPASMQAVKLQTLGKGGLGTAVDLQPVGQLVFGVDIAQPGVGIAEH